MERFFRLMLNLGIIALIAGAVAVTSCSDDSGTDPKPNPNDTTGNQDTSTNTMDERMRPIVFVHGELEAADMYSFMSQLLMKNGYTEQNMFVFDFQSYLTDDGVDVTAMATQLQAKVNEALAATSEQRVDIVAHGAGAKAVQHFLARMSGTAKVAHVVYAGAVYDMALTVNGDPTPAPCEYMTLRSNGQDALQLGNTQHGVLTGAKNEQLNGLDNFQLVSSSEAVAKVYNFFTGTTMAEANLTPPRPGLTYTIKGRVIDFIDNTPLVNASVIPVKVRRLASGEIQRQVGQSPLTTDSKGYFQYDDLLAPDTFLEFLVRSATGSHFDMHIYRQPWRANSISERLRVLPRSGGSIRLGQFGAALRTGSHGIAIIFTQNQALYHSRDQLVCKRYTPGYELISSTGVLTQGNAPSPGSSATGMNTFLLCLLDYDQNMQDGVGPISTPALNTYGINSHDFYLDVSATNHQTHFELNGAFLGSFNYRSSGASGSNNSGINLVQFEYKP